MFESMPFAVFPFFSGQTLPDWPDWPIPLLEEMARTLATIHRATPALADVLPPREDFAVSFEADLRRGLEAIEQIGPDARPGLRALRDLVLPRRDDILAQLTYLHRLRQAVSRLSGPFVLCHTDFGGDNLLVDEQGQLAVIDWDDATVAPPEHDLQSLLGSGFARALQAYWEVGGTRSLHLDHFAFYLLRRYLEDMTARLLRILQEPSSAREDEENLAGIVAYGFAQWAVLDETLATIAAALQQHAP
jgi:aminoglycoside phosphotransferase (APT) family kinase protein